MSYQQKNTTLYIINFIFSFFNKRKKNLIFILCFFLFACTSVIHSQRPAVYTPKSHSGQSVKISRPYTVHGKTYYPHQQVQSYQETGIASWYGKKFHGRPTASGEIYNMYQESAAHKLLPLHTKVRVTNLENGKKVVVRINDRGPFVKNRIIDLSYAAARKLGMIQKGTARVRIQTLGYWDKNTPGKFYIQMNSFTQKQNALNYKKSLKEKGFAHVRIQRANLYSGIFWRVQIGAYRTYAQAFQVMTKIIKNSGCFIIAD